jgi:hypothetical protein
MIARARFKSVQWLLLAMLALAPMALAQQAPAKTEAPQGQKEATPAKTETPQAQPEAQTKTDEDGKLISVPGGKALGMSILGNQEAPTSLVIVPWKSSEIGKSFGISTMLDDSRQPIDREVFMRMLSYYELSKTTRPSGSSAAPPATAARRNP